MVNLLLASNGKMPGKGFLDHCFDDVKATLGGVERILFVPYARPGGITHDEYAKVVRQRFVGTGYEVDSLHEFADPFAAIRKAQAYFVGGGNTFVLLREFQLQRALLATLRGEIVKGKPYVGTSAGANLACPTIATTNDNPIVELPDGTHALNLIPFQIKPHYMDPDAVLVQKFAREPDEIRLREYHGFNKRQVLGIREGGYLRVQGNPAEYCIELKGNSAVLFVLGAKPLEIRPSQFKVQSEEFMAYQLVFATTVHSSMIRPEVAAQGSSPLQMGPFWSRREDCSRDEQGLLGAQSVHDDSKVVRVGGFYGLIWDQNTRRIVVPVFNGLASVGSEDLFANIELIAHVDRGSLEMDLEQLFSRYHRENGQQLESHRAAWKEEIAKYKRGDLDYAVQRRLKEIQK